MGRKRPCRICRHWFRPHPRAGDRQHVCSRADCQRERHRRACQRWRQREAPAERAHRLRQRVRAELEERHEAVGRRVSWDAVRDAVGLKVAVILEEISRLLEDVARDAVQRQVGAATWESRQVLPTGRRDDMVSEVRGP
jgi:hypothetical protein